MRHETTLIFTDSLIREAVLAFWRRSVGLGFGVAVLAVAAGLGFLVRPITWDFSKSITRIFRWPAVCVRSTEVPTSCYPRTTRVLTLASLA
jgi:hypothetical protein